MTTPTAEATAAPVVEKSCATCPSFTNTHDSVGVFGKTTGAPMCARFGTVLGQPKFTNKENEKLQVVIGSKCKQHGSARPKQPVTFAPNVAHPMEDIPEAISPENVNTCTSCIFWLDPQEVMSRYGWAAGLCQARGLLVLTHSTSQTAQSCGVKSYGTPKVWPHELWEFYTPEYYHVDLFKAYGAGVDHPLLYPSDFPVTDEDAKNGIHAWRKISDPQDNNRFTKLPIYSPEGFSEAERAKIPQPGDDEHPELYLDHSNMVYKIAVCWRELDETPMAWGAAGLGKTEVARHMAYLMQLPFERFSITASTELDDLAGKMMFVNNETIFQKGRLPLAWERPCVMLLDEPNAGQPDVWQFLRPLTDNSKQLVLDTAKGERVTRHDHAHLMMAANPSWDPLNVGVNQIGDADASRLMHLKFGLPPEALEKKIIKARVGLDGWEIKNHNLDLIMGVAADIRGMCQDGTLPITWGIRVQIKVARAMKWFSPVQAYKLATDDLEPGVQDSILMCVKSRFPEEDES